MELSVIGYRLSGTLTGRWTLTPGVSELSVALLAEVAASYSLSVIGLRSGYQFA